jgi:hypothetical protein
MPISSRAARRSRAGRPLAPLAVRLAGVLATIAPLALLGAQAPARPADPWSFDAQYLQLAPTATSRDATPSLGLTLGRALGRGSVEWRAEAGWSRAVRRGTSAQGATLGLSAGIPLGGRLGRLVLRPGVSALAGWAESQDSVALYAWRGEAGTPLAGTTGSQLAWSTVRGRTLAIGASLGAELRLTRSIGVAASVRQWHFGGDAASPNRDVTLAGIGMVVRPRLAAGDARRWWRGVRSSDRSANTSEATRHESQSDRDHAEAGR